MRSTSKARAGFWGAFAHNPSLARKSGIPMVVAKQYVAADKSKGKLPIKAPDAQT
jgi:hypothetical protein